MGTAGLAAALLAVPALAGCSGEGGTAAAPATTAATAPADRPSPAAGIMLSDAGISVSEALAAAPSDDLVVVRAHLLVDADGSARLCDALLESYPPGCGGAQMTVTNIPEGFLDGLSAEGGLRWSDQPLQLIGRMRDGAFANDPQALVAG
jgi:hypothetical protein